MERGGKACVQALPQSVCFSRIELIPARKALRAHIMILSYRIWEGSYPVGTA